MYRVICLSLRVIEWKCTYVFAFSWAKTPCGRQMQSLASHLVCAAASGCLHLRARPIFFPLQDQPLGEQSEGIISHFSRTRLVYVCVTVIKVSVLWQFTCIFTSSGLEKVYIYVISCSFRTSMNSIYFVSIFLSGTLGVFIDNPMFRVLTCLV